MASLRILAATTDSAIDANYDLSCAAICADLEAVATLVQSLNLDCHMYMLRMHMCMYVPQSM